MAIKVRHDQNATATLTAAAEGGAGKRRAEDSKSLAQISAQQNMAGNRQNQGAHAQAVSPGQAHTQLGSASLLGAPKFEYNPELADEVSVGNDPTKQPSPNAYWRDGKWWEKNYTGKYAATRADALRPGLHEDATYAKLLELAGMPKSGEQQTPLQQQLNEIVGTVIGTVRGRTNGQMPLAGQPGSVISAQQVQQAVGTPVAPQPTQPAQIPQSPIPQKNIDPGFTPQTNDWF